MSAPFNEPERTSTLPELQAEPEAAGKIEVRRLEDALQKLWEKARLVSESVTRVREENEKLKQRLAELESVERKLISEQQKNDLELQRTRSDVLKLQSNGSDFFTKEEKEALKQRIKELILRINSRL